MGVIEKYIYSRNWLNLDEELQNALEQIPRKWEFWRKDKGNQIEIDRPDAKAIMREKLASIFGSYAQWPAAYDRVANWLADNRGKGLLLLGNCGTGKSILCREVIPAIISDWNFSPSPLHGEVISAYELNDIYREDKQHLLKPDVGFLTIDDLGVETPYNDFGVRYYVFSEIIDAAERNGRLLLLSSNLTIAQLTERYGLRTIDRLKALTTAVIVDGDSLRGKWRRQKITRTGDYNCFIPAWRFRRLLKDDIRKTFWKSFSEAAGELYPTISGKINEATFFEVMAICKTAAKCHKSLLELAHRPDAGELDIVEAVTQMTSDDGKLESISQDYEQ